MDDLWLAVSPPPPPVEVRHYSDEEILSFSHQAASFIFYAVRARIAKWHALSRSWLAGTPYGENDLERLVGEFGRVQNELTVMTYALELPGLQAAGRSEIAYRSRKVIIRRFPLLVRQVVLLMNLAEASAEGICRVRDKQQTLAEYCFQQALELNDRLAVFERLYWIPHDADMTGLYAT